MNALLEDVKPLVRETLPFLEVGDCVIHVQKGLDMYDIEGIYLEHKNAGTFPVGYCTALSIAIDGEWVIVGIHCVGTKTKNLRRETSTVDLQALLQLIHTAWVGRDEVS